MSSSSSIMFDKFEQQLAARPIAALTVPIPATALATASASVSATMPSEDSLAGKKRSHSEMEMTVQKVSCPSHVNPFQIHMQTVEKMTLTLLDDYAAHKNKELIAEKTTLEERNATQALEIRNMKARLANVENQINEIKILKERNAQLEARLAAIRSTLGNI